MLQNGGMIDQSFRYLLVPVALCMSLVFAGPARAALGGDAASVAADTLEVPGIDHPTLLQQYDIHEITSDNGMRVREFLNRAGIVFAVAWSGPVIPDLHMLLGTYFTAYFNARTMLKLPGTRRSLRITTSDMVVESGGHMRAFSGRAYLPALIPPGTAVADLS